MKKILLFFFIILIVLISCEQKQITFDEYISLPVWDKEEEAFNIINEISIDNNLDEL